jgi:GxxExxY protein
MIFEPIEDSLNEIGKEVVDSAYQVHTNLGPGLLESVYQKCFIAELKERNLSFDTEVLIPIKYKYHEIDANLRLDVMIEDKVIVELKSVEQMLPVFEAQLLTYLKLTGKRLGFLINFNVPKIKDGIKRFII